MLCKKNFYKNFQVLLIYNFIKIEIVLYDYILCYMLSYEKYIILYILL